GCALGTICAPTPCQSESCSASFSCLADNPGGSASCTFNPECNCPGGVGYDGPARQYCTVARKYEDVCEAGVSTAESCASASLRSVPLQCCGPNETFDPQTGSCASGCAACEPACAATEFCERSLCRCLPKGG